MHAHVHAFCNKFWESKKSLVFDLFYHAARCDFLKILHNFIVIFTKQIGLVIHLSQLCIYIVKAVECALFKNIKRTFGNEKM